MVRPQRIRDAVHNVIEFDAGEFEQTCWKVLNTRPMQRLRRIKQLGFSDFVYPGACHSRFAHSIGVFHTARQLAGVVRRRLGEDKYDNNQSRLAQAAALVHDVGHGPFSHAFEDALKRLKIRKRHEIRTTDILKQTDVVSAFEEFSEYPGKIAEIIESSYPKNIYESLVSSQFDADRLDYMRRDRLMSGTQQSGIDYDWLVANLHVRKIPVQVDSERVGTTEALVIDEKSITAAEGYIFSLLYLYINVYYHKTTRGIEKLFSLLVELVGKCVLDGSLDRIGLPKYHPLITFIREPDSIDKFLNLDDSVVVGGLTMLAESRDEAIAELAARIRDRKIYACVDVSKRIAAKFGVPATGNDSQADRLAVARERVAKVGELASERGMLSPGAGGLCGILEDTAPRSPYKRVSDGSQAFSRIHVIGSDDNLYDLADLSPAVDLTPTSHPVGSRVRR